MLYKGRIMNESILPIIVKFLFIVLFAFFAISIITAFILKGKRLSNTEWPYSVLIWLSLLRLGKYFDKRGWRLANREIIGLIIVIILMILGFLLIRK
jgi:hypothetical protein